MKNTAKKFVNNFAFIDSQNLNLGIESQGWKLDFSKFRIYLKHRFFVTQAYIFIGYVSGYESLYVYLQKCGYIVIHKPTLEIDGKIKDNCDADLVLHTMIEYENYDKAVIVSGDGDFHCLLEYLEQKDKLEKLLVPNYRSYSSLLKRFNRDTVFLNQLKEKIGREGLKKK